MAQFSAPSIGIVIPTLNAERHLSRCLPPLLRSSLTSRVLVIDSSSDDRTVFLAEQLGAETLVIPRHEFNHGTAREKARHYLNTDIVVMMTQDAYALDDQLIKKLIDPILCEQTSISYARQIPHEGADIFETFPRHFNYSLVSHFRGIEDVATYGIYTFFCSNSCAAYRNAALNEIGGFKRVLFGEDTLAVAELLHRGHKIAYVAEAVVRHSHRYSLSQEFRRHFDIGLSRSQLHSLISCAKGDQKRGLNYLRALTCYLVKEDPLLLPYAYFQTGFKWLGYKLGAVSLTAPTWFKKAFSSQSYYWD